VFHWHALAGTQASNKAAAPIRPTYPAINQQHASTLLAECSKYRPLAALHQAVSGLLHTLAHHVAAAMQ
jgi:hypothetical protein